VIGAKTQVSQPTEIRRSDSTTLVLGRGVYRWKKCRKRGCSPSMPAEGRYKEGLLLPEAEVERIVTARVVLSLPESLGRERRQ